MRFDASIFPSIEQIKERCQRDPAEIMGRCAIPMECVVSHILTERVPADVRVNTYPSRYWEKGVAYLSWPDERDVFASISQQYLPLPEEINTLAFRFDGTHLSGQPVTAREVEQLCDGIINQREERAA